PTEGRSPHRRRDALIIDRALLIEGARAEQGADMIAKPWADGEVSLERRRHETRKAMKVEAAALAGKPLDALVPVAAREIRQLIAQVAAIQGGESVVATFAEHAEEIIEFERANAGDFQLEERRLARVRVDGMNTLRAENGIVENIATRAGDD